MKLTLLTIALIAPLLSTPVPPGSSNSASMLKIKQLGLTKPNPNPLSNIIKPPNSSVKHPQQAGKNSMNLAKAKSANLQENYEQLQDSEHSMQDAIDAAEDLVIKMKEKQESLAEEDNLFGPGSWLYNQVSTLASKV